MLEIRYNRFFSLLLSFALLIAPLPLTAIAQDIAVNLPEWQADIITQNSDVSYIYLGKELSNIAEMLSRISDLEQETNSPLYELKKHINDGFLFIKYDEIIEILEYAQSVIQKKHTFLNSDCHDIAVKLEVLINQIANGDLTMDAATVTRSPHLRTVVINENIDVLGKSTFEKHIRVKQGINMSGKLKVAKSATFKKNVHIKGMLSVADILVGSLSITDLVVVSCVDSLCVNSLSTTDLIVTDCVDDLCINNLSVVDESVSGTLSVNDAYIVNAVIENLTVTATILDSIINNLTVNVTLSTHDEVVNNVLAFKSAGSNFIGVHAPSVVPTSYTLSLPPTVPTAHQIIRANALTPTNLEWATEGGSVIPVNSETIYVAKYGNDTTGDGSFNNPYATLAKAIDIANVLANVNYPICIFMSPGIYIENNAAGPLTITTDGISIVGFSPEATYIMPSTPANNLILANGTIRIANIAIESSAPLATGLSLTVGNFSTFDNVRFANFQTGVFCSGGTGQLYGFNSCVFVANATGLSLNNSRAELLGCNFFGSFSIAGPAANTGISITGAGANLVVDGGAIGKCVTGFDITGNSVTTINGVSFKFNTSDIIQSGASHMVLNGSSFELTNGSADIDIQISGAGTVAEIVGCQFNGNSLFGVPEGTSIFVSDNASLDISSGSVKNYTTALHAGTSSDTASTIAYASALTIENCTNDIIQEGSATLNFNAGSASGNKIIINDPTNVELAFFDLNDNGSLTIGSTANQNTSLVQVDINPTNHPELNYKSSLYSTQAFGFENIYGSPSSLYILSANNTDVTSITTDRTKIAGLRLVSDTGSPVGGTSALRGWDINKNGSAAALSFTYQNSDIVGQSAISPYVVMQLDGVNNQLQLPTVGTQIVFDADTNLYRSAANVLKTDDNFIVGTLTPGRVVITDPTTNQLASSITTSTELGYLSGVTSPIQAQLNSKVNKSGDIMTGTLQLPAGTASAPSLTFTGSTTTGLSAPTPDVLSFDTNGVERLNLSSSGLTIDQFTTAGVVHNNALGLLSSSLIVDADITAATITNDKLAHISSSNVPGDIVVRDGSGNFQTNMITLLGSVVNNTDATTKAYVDMAIALGIAAKTPALVVSTTDIGSPPTGLQTIDGVALSINDRVLLVGQTDQVYNGLWLAQTSAWTRPADFANGTEVGQAYVLILEGAVNAGSSWLCNTPTAIIGTDPITFAEFSLPSQTTGANVGAGTGQVYQSKSGITLNFRTLLQGAHLTIATNSDTVSFTTDATNVNTPSTIVARDSSGNFSAGTITASLTGAASLNVLKTGDTMTGALTLPAGTIVAPSLIFTGSNPGTGISAPITDTLSFDIMGSEQMNISASGVAIDGFTTPGIVHNDSSGLLSSSLIVNADVSASAGIVDTKLATISTAGKVANSATTATSANTPNTIVERDASGNFNASTIIANLMGAASLNVLKTGDTMTGTLQLPAGTTASPSLVFTGSTTTGLSASAGNLSFSTNAVERMKISSGGIISIDAFTVPGVVHNDASGNLSSSLIVNGDVNPAAGIVDTKLATISTAGKVANSATTATSANVANSIVLRDSSGNFSAGTVSFNDAIITNATITNLSVLEEIITNLTIVNLSATDAIITNSTITNLSVSDAYIASLSVLDETISGTSSITDAIVTNATIANLSVTNCIANLCVNNLSVVNESVSGTLSVNNEIVTNITATHISATDAIMTSATITHFSVSDEFVTNLSVVNETVTGTLSVNNEVVQSLTVANCMASLCVNNLSVVNESVSGTLSVNNEIVTNITATTLSVTNEVVQNLAITNLSVVNETVTGTLSVANEIVTNITATELSTTDVFAQTLSSCDVIVACDIKMNNSTSSSVGNILKAGNSFINNFGTNNTFVGVNAGNFTTSGSGNNSGFGGNALTANGTGAFNTAIGYSALAANTIGINNTALGNNALAVSTTGTDNTAIGFNALAANATGTSSNTAVGSSALAANTTGTNNAAVGKSALAANTVGINNTALGNNALAVSTTGTDNTAIGFNALAANATGTSFNTAVGSSALAANTTGTNNAAVGYQALKSNTIGTHNTALGYNALAVSTTGTDNTALGYNALAANATGTSSNTAVGSSALAANTTGTLNTAVGKSALAANTVGINNTALGNNALAVSTTGTDNTAIGFNALTANATGTSNNTAVGSSALSTNTVGSNNTAVGYQALQKNTVSSLNTAIGSTALANNTTGLQNSAAGSAALFANTTGSGNTAIGYTALHGNVSGNFNIAVGGIALFTNQGGSNNTAVGYSALGSNTASNNTAVGYQALNVNTAAGNTAVGYNALTTNTTGTNNAAVGFQALTANTVGSNNTALGNNALAVSTTGTDNTAIGFNALAANATGTSFNTAIGSSALAANTTGTNNAAVGYQALKANTIGTHNTALGYNALAVSTTGTDNTALGYSSLPAVTTGSINIAIGSGAGSTLTTGSGNIYINANAGSSSESSTTRIGTSQTTCFIQGINGVTTGLAAIAVLVDGNGQLGTISSTRTVKHAIEDMADASAHILDLRPVTFVYNSDTTETKQYGLIAEEVAEIFPDIVVKDQDDNPYTIQYHILPILLLNEMKKQQTTINQQHSTINQQQVALGQQQSIIDNLVVTTQHMNVAIDSLQNQLKHFIERLKSLENHV